MLHLNGLTLVQCVQDIQVSGESVDLNKLRVWLAERGINVPRGGKHHSIMRLWLEKAGVFVAHWRVDNLVLQALLHLDSQELEALASFTPAQQAYLRTLASVDEPGPFRSNEIEKLAASVYGVKFNEKNLPKDILYPLRDAGFISVDRGTDGRGGRPFQVSGTSKLEAEIVVPLLAQFQQQVQASLRPLLRRPLASILSDLDDLSTHQRGLALEALAFKLMRLLDMSYVATRLRGDATGGAEVDLIFQSARLVFSRWQIQCKNSARVSLDDVAKEVGLTQMLHSNAIVMVSTGQIGPEARRYANTVMATSNLCIVMLDRTDVNRIVAAPSAIVDVFRREAEHAMNLKPLHLGDGQ